MIAIDRPGFGYSDFGMLKFNGAISNNRLLYQIDNKQPMILVGHSYGGPMVC
jgi:pimeloyl-ACP methyl ester carboxylesterase